ncbi:MAG: hypothetical protein ACRDKZ_16270, partial [Actinomycetota bacterium]
MTTTRSHGRLGAGLCSLALALALMGASVPARAIADRASNPDASRARSAELRKAKRSGDRLRWLERAFTSGYRLLRDSNGIECIAEPGKGAMGIHFVNGELVGDAEIDPLHPEAVVYEPTRRGWLRLVAVEYVVFKDAWDAEHEARPRLFGRRFKLVEEGNRYGLPAFYELHAWLWKR